MCGNVICSAGGRSSSAGFYYTIAPAILSSKILHKFLTERIPESVHNAQTQFRFVQTAQNTGDRFVQLF
jgi:hypothetical protein